MEFPDAKKKIKVRLPEKLMPKAEIDVSCNARVKIVIGADGAPSVLQYMVADKSIFVNGAYTKRKAENVVAAAPVRIEKEAVREMTTADLKRAAQADRLIEAHFQPEPEKAEKTEPRPENMRRSAQRARTRIYDMVSADVDLCWFITLTLNGEKFARDDARTALNRLQAWLRNKVQRDGLKYIIVPEYHSDGRCVHFHGVINSALKLESSGTYIRPSGGRPVRTETIRRAGIDLSACTPVYNIPAWDYGYTTAIPVYGERTSVAAYICKYITKEIKEISTCDLKKIGGRYFLHSSNIAQPVVLYGYADFDAADGLEFENPACSVKISYPSFTEFCENAFSTMNGTQLREMQNKGREAETDI